jgi:hypothetical protein
LDLSAELYKRLSDKALEISRQVREDGIPRMGYTDKDTYQMIHNWYRANDRVILIDPRWAEQGYQNVILLGIAWTPNEEEHYAEQLLEG